MSTPCRTWTAHPCQHEWRPAAPFEISREALRAQGTCSSTRRSIAFCNLSAGIQAIALTSAEKFVEVLHVLFGIGAGTGLAYVKMYNVVYFSIFRHFILLHLLCCCP